MSDRNGFLGPPRTGNYRPSVIGPRIGLDHRGVFSVWDVEPMRRDPQIAFGLRILYAPLPSAKWKTEGDSEVIDFVDRTVRKIWSNHLAQLFKMVVYGWAGGEVLYSEDGDDVAFDRIKDVHPFDMRPLRRDNLLAGVSVRGISPDDSGRSWILPPRSLWLAHEAEFGSLYGRSRMEQAWFPWKEKTGRHGAIDVRRLWFIKNAYRGGTMRHPAGEIEVSAGVYMSCMDYAREIVERGETGGVMTLPNTTTENGEYEWTYEPPAANSSPPDIRDYPKDLDDEILTAMGVPPEVAKASEVGSGWSGRAIPFVTYLRGEDLIVQQILTPLNEQIIRPMVAHNFSPAAAKSYQITPVSLVPEETAQDAAQTDRSGQEGDQVRMSAAHAPAGGITVAGKKFKGGEFIPGKVLAKASPDEKKELEKRTGKGGKGPAKSGTIDLRPSAGSTGPSKPEERKDVEPPILEDRPEFEPPRATSKAPLDEDGVPSKGYSANGMTNTQFGDMSELLMRKVGMRSILPEGQRSNKSIKLEGSSIDLEYDHSGWVYELKACSVEATSYKSGPKKHEIAGKKRYARMHGLKPATMVLVVDVEKGTAHAYWQPGIVAKKLEARNLDEWHYAGSVEFTGDELRAQFEAKAAERAAKKAKRKGDKS